MCLIVFGYQTVPGYRLILAANRDEFYNRPSLPARFWKENSKLLAGKDEVSGGTWLGIHLNGQFAAVTNYRDMSAYNPDAKSRGHLIKNYLKGKNQAAEFLKNLDEIDNYNGFNLLVGDLHSFYHFSNQLPETTLIQPGIHGISNALLNSPWPKVEQSKKQFRKLMESNNLTEENLFKLLLDTRTYPEHLLPKTGLPVDKEKAASAIFIKTSDYGTRCATILSIKEDGSVRFVERVYRPGTTDVELENGYDFRINSEL